MFENMKIAKRVTIICAIILSVASLSGVVGVVISNVIDKDYSKALVSYGFSQENIGRVGISIQRERALLLEMITTADESTKNENLQTIKDLDVVVDTNLKKIEESLASESGRKMYEAIVSVDTSFRTVRDELLSVITSSDAQTALAFYNEKCLPVILELNDAVDTLLTEKSTLGTAESDSLTQQSVIFTFVMIFTIIAGVIIAIVMSKRLADALKRPIFELEHVAQQMSNGDLKATLTYESENELGMLSKSMNKTIAGLSGIVSDLTRILAEVADGNFVVAPSVDYPEDFAPIEASLRSFIAKISQTLSQINDSSEQVAGSAEQISQGAQSLTEGATDQASSIEELQATVTSVSAEVDRNAKNAEEANSKAQSVGTEISASNSQMQQMVAAMNLISESSQQINNIINTINDIAAQTNLLSLNASIEAARAGEMGKGFAVVANEVGSLAAQSAQAAQSSTELIANSLKAVENGKQLADLTASKLETSVSKTQELVSEIAEISDASVRQAEALDQISQAVEQIASVVEENTAMAEESSSSSEEMASQAALLKELIQQFKLHA